MKEVGIIRFCDLINSLEPVFEEDLNRDELSAEVISLLTLVPDDVLGTDRDPAVIATESIRRKLCSSDAGLSKRLARAIHRYFDYEGTIERIDSQPPQIKQLISDRLEACGWHVELEDLGRQYAMQADIVVMNKAKIDVDFDNLQDKAAHAYSLISNKENLLIQSDGRCARCTQSLVVSGDGRQISSFKIVPIDPMEKVWNADNLVVMCPQCAALYEKNESTQEIELVRQSKSQLIRHQDLLESMTPIGLEKELSILLERMPALLDEELADGIGQNFNPVEVDAKIPQDNVLRREVKDDVSTYYSFLSKKMTMLQASQMIPFMELCHQIKIRYLTLHDKGLSQSEIFDHLSDWIADRTHSRSRTASILVSYFVQICEVFRAPAQ